MLIDTHPTILDLATPGKIALFVTCFLWVASDFPCYGQHYHLKIGNFWTIFCCFERRICTWAKCWYWSKWVGRAVADRDERNFISAVDVTIFRLLTEVLWLTAEGKKEIIISFSGDQQTNASSVLYCCIYVAFVGLFAIWLYLCFLFVMVYPR